MKRVILLAVVLATAVGAGCSSSSSSASFDEDAGGAGGGDDSGTTPDDGGAGGTDAGSGGSSDAGTITPSNAVSIIVEPNGKHASELVAAVQAGTKSVYVTMYMLDNKAFLGALEAKAKAGVDVKVVLDGSSVNKTFNTPAYDALNAIHAGTAVWSNPSFTYTHEKCVIIDGAQAWIMTMNVDQSAPDADREYLAIDTQAADVTEATAVFQADFAHTSITPTGNLVVANTNARTALVTLIGTATKSLDLELEELSDMTKN
ncbi:MAG: phospholipase D-like domain-containing protein, partial [Polyangiaceae bacterium]